MTTTTVASPQRGGGTGHSAASVVVGRHVASMLVLRLAAFAFLQALVALVLMALGDDRPWTSSAAWWPLTASAANIINLGVLRGLAQREGFALSAFYRPRRARVGRDLSLALAVAVIGGALAFVGNVSLGTALWGDATTGTDRMISPLPMWAAALAVVLFPVTTAAAELPHYYGYVQPRLAQYRNTWWIAIALPALFHSLQHIMLPLIVDSSFIMWRALMFAPFALLVAWVLRRRRYLLPYLVVIHFVIDLQTALLVLAVAG